MSRGIFPFRFHRKRATYSALTDAGNIVTPQHSLLCHALDTLDVRWHAAAMPLRARIDGTDVLAPLLSDAQWETLQTKARTLDHPLVLPCCGSSGRCRVNMLGTRHFVHNRRAECTWEPETAQHLLAKEAIVRGCAAADFEVRPEYSEGDWHADVLAVRNADRIAFEVQWSSQTADETQACQLQYHAANVRGYWFFRKIPARLLPQKETPAFVMRFDAHVPVVSIGNQSWPLVEFTTALLARRVQFRDSLTALTRQRVRIALAPMECWNCHFVSTIYYVEEGLLTPCGSKIHIEDVLWSDKKLEFAPAIQRAVAAQLVGGKWPAMGDIKPRSSRPVGHKYMSFGCPRCDAIFGDWHLLDFVTEHMGEVDRDIIEVDLDLPSQYSNPVPHWCFDHGSGHCDE